VKAYKDKFWKVFLQDEARIEDKGERLEAYKESIN
jgi:hypothetical protein